MRDERSRLSEEDRHAASALIASIVVDHGLLGRSAVVAVYASIGAEADPRHLERLLTERGLEVVYPRVEGRFLSFRIARLHALVASPTGLALPEPPMSAPEVALEDIDAFVVPGLAFSRNGQRLGYGGGYYDRVLARVRAVDRGTRACAVPQAFGFAFACQIVDSLPEEAWDQRMDAVATEGGVLRF